MINYMQYKTTDVITYPCPDPSWTMLIKYHHSDNKVTPGKYDVVGSLFCVLL